ncbi:hypothetical protein EMCRGX_G015101 [Ephydatia muelleri]
MGKACRILLSSGIAPSNSTTLNLLQSKNPSCPHPMIPDIASNPVTLGPSFDILHIMRSFTKGTSAGPSGLSIQHLLDAASVPLQTPICDSLKGVVNILASGKCLCSILRDKFSTFFQPSQFGVACKAGVERVVHNLRKCIDDGWMSGDFVVCKVDMSNAFNRVSRQAVLDECSSFFPELLPWLTVRCSAGGSPWPMLFALVLHKLVSSIEADDDCINLSFNAWYLDDGILVRERSAVVRALHLIEELAPHLGLFINYPKCEVFSRNGISLFPASVKSSILPNLEILGAPIGDIVHCSRFFAEKHNNFKVLLRAISDVAAVDLHVASLSSACAEATARLHHHGISAQFSSPAEVAVSKAGFFRIPFSAVFSFPGEQGSHALSFSSPYQFLDYCYPFYKFKLHLDSAEYQMAIRWWLGLNTSEASPCPFCPELVLDPLGHHAASCRHGGDVVTRHNR